MSQYASKSALWNAISSCQTDIDRLSEELRQLKDAKKKTVDVRWDADKLQRDMSTHKGSLNKVFGGFSWEGTNVRNVQKVYGDAVSTMSTYVTAMDDRILSIENQIDSVETRKYLLEQNKINLQNQYDAWKDE